MRLFTGLEIPETEKSELNRLIQRLRPLARVRWSPVENLHVTTKFIGEWPEPRLAELTAALGSVPKPGAIEVRLSGLGWFPNPHQPRIFWVAVKAPPALAALAQATSDRLSAELGIAAENRPFAPHLTLARTSGASTAELAPLRREVAGLPSVDFGSFVARAFHLYLSEPEAGPGGASRYTKLASFPLINQAEEQQNR